MMLNETDVLPVTVSCRCSSGRCGGCYGSRLGITVRRVAPLVLRVGGFRRKI